MKAEVERLYSVFIGTKLFRDNESRAYARQAVTVWNRLRGKADPPAKMKAQT